MATAALTDNRVYLYRLLTLSTQLGTTIIRNLIDDRCSNISLAAVLSQEKSTISKLRAKGIITKAQFDVLYPQDGRPPSTADFDFNLGIFLLWNLKYFGLFSRNVTPNSADTSNEADIDRLRMYRNELAHQLDPTGIQAGDFNTKWAHIEMILHRLNNSVEHPIPNLQQIIDDIKSGPLEPKAKNVLEEQTEMLETRLDVASVEKDIREMPRKSEAVLARTATEKDLQHIAQSVGSNWEMLGPYLLKQNAMVIVEHIKEDHRRIEMRVHALLLTWKQQAAPDTTLSHLFHQMLQVGTCTSVEWTTIAEYLNIDERDIRACKLGYQPPVQERSTKPSLQHTDEKFTESVDRIELDTVKTYIDKAWGKLVDYMSPGPILDCFVENELFSIQETRAIKEEKTTTEKNRSILYKVRSKGIVGYTNFKTCLIKTKQTLLVELLECIEKGEDTSVLEKQLYDEAIKTTPKMLKDIDPRSQTEQDYEERKKQLPTPDQPQLPEEIARLGEESVETYIKALEKGETISNKVRVMVVGHCKVGKSTLVKRLFGQFDNEDIPPPTNGIETHVRQCKVNTDDKNDVEWKPLTDGNKIHLSHILLQEAQNTALDDSSVEKAEPTNVEKGDRDDAANLPQSSEETKCTVQGHESSEVEEGQVQDQQKTNQRQYVMELMQDTPKDQEDNINKTHISVWDFAGQYAFYNTHQVFFTRRAVYLIVTDMSKGLYEEVDDACCEDSRGARKLRVIDFARFWLNSVHEFCQSKEKKGPPVLLVGTFADEYAKKQNVDKTKYQDKKEKEQLKQNYFSKLRDELGTGEASNHISKHFMIDNMCTLDDDSQFKEIKKEILDIIFNKDQDQDQFEKKEKKDQDQNDFRYRIPTKFLLLEEALNKKREEGIKILEKKDLSNCNEELPFKLDEKELDLFLDFYHELGSFIYFGDYNLKDNILLEPQWLIDAFRKLITTKECMPNADTKTHKKWQQFDKKAILTKDLIDLSWKDIEMNERTHLLDYMKKLGLIVPNKKEQDSYFAPCVLKQAPPEYLLKLGDDKNCECSFSADGRSFTSILCYTTKSRFIPTAIFNRLLAECISRWDIFTEENKEDEKEKERMHIYCGCGLFQLQNAQILYVHFRANVVQIWIVRLSDIAPSKDTCIEVKKHMDNFLYSVFKKDDIELHFRCPTGSPLSNTMLSQADLEKDDSVLCKVHGRELTSIRLTGFWISDNTSDEEEEDTNDTDTEEPGERFSLSAEHKTSAYVLKAKAAALESVCRISYKELCGTGFRVGSKYVMTAAHVLTGIYKKGEKLIQKRTKEDVLKETDAEFDYLKTDAPKTIFKFNGDVFSDNILDVAILELKDHASENVPMRDALTILRSADRKCKFHFIGHSDGEPMAVDENLQIEKKGKISKFCQTVTRKSKELKMDSKWTETVQKKSRNDQAHYFNTCFEKGASGSPGIVILDDGCAVVTMLTSGYPQWYYKSGHENKKQQWCREYCIEEGVNMKALYKTLKKENEGLCQDIFQTK